MVKKITMVSLALLGLTLGFQLIANARNIDLKTVRKVDINKYAGKWYEIASFPNRFQKGCTLTTAEYSLNEDGTVKVKNSCRIDGPEGKLSDIEGKAFVVPNSRNTKLKVQFFWPFKGDYWIIMLDEKDYSYAVVSEPGKDYLWILSRTPKMNKQTYEFILSTLRDKGFDLQKLNKTLQLSNK